MEPNPNPTTTTNSPEFEFRHPSSHQPTLLSADQLFSGGLILPLHQLSIHHPPDPPNPPTNPPSLSTNNSILEKSDFLEKSDLLEKSDCKPTPTSSKRWKDMFKKTPDNKDSEKKKKKKDRNSGAGAGGTTAELNINLWPFSRSRSAGNSVNRPRTAVGGRKVSSAPCSRSNSTGDKCRRWPNSPGRAGVHLGRSSPVWQAKRVGQNRSLLHDNSVARSSGEKGGRTATGAGGNVAGGKVLNINVPKCIGYRQRVGCRSDLGKESRGVAGDVPAASVAGAGDGGGSGLFNLRSLFTKKVF